MYAKVDLTVDEITYSKNTFIKLSQQLYFSEEYEDLIQGRQINNKSNLQSLAPFLRTNGIMKVRGRLKNSGLSYDDLADLLITYTYQILCHAEYNIILRALK